MSLFELIHEDNASAPNFHFDVLQIVRLSAALAVTANEVNANAFQTDLDWIEHIEEDIEPPDGTLPLASIVYWFETVGANRRLMGKYKSAAGVVYTKNMGLFTP